MFKHNKNIIESYSFLTTNNNIIYKSYFKKIERVYDSIISYFTFSLNCLKENSPSGCGYLVTKNWIDGWQKYTNYKIIKEKYLKKNGEMDNSTKNNIINYLIDYFEDNKGVELNKIKIIKKNDIKIFIQEDSLVLVDYYFLNSLMENKFSIKDYSLSFTKTGNTIILERENDLKFRIINNIILSLTEKSYIEDLNQLIKIYCFQEELKNKINNINQNSFNFNGNIDNIILINNKIIKRYKEYFNYNELYKILKSNNITPSYFLKDDKLITTIIDKNENILKEYISTIEQKNSGKIQLDDNSQYNIIEKPLNSQENRLKYINEFEIINNDIYSFFKNKPNFNNINCLNANYITKNGHILIYNKNFIEIGIINDNNDFLIKYLIKEINSFTKVEAIISHIKRYGIEYFTKDLPQEISDIEDPNYGLIAHCYKVKTNENINNNDNNSIRNEDIQFIKAIVSILVSLFKFNKELKIKIENSKNETNIHSSYQTGEYCFLINKNFVLKFKRLFSSDNIFDYNILNKSESDSLFDIEREIYQKIIKRNNIDKFLEKKSKLLELFNKNEYSTFQKINCKLGTDIYVPSCFELIDENTNQKIINLNINIEKNMSKIEKSQYGINKGKVILKINDKKFSEFSNSLYIFSVQFNNENIFYIPEIVFYFNENNQRINIFISLCKGENIEKYYSNQNSDYSTYLLTNDLNNISINNNRNQEKIKQYLYFIIIMNKEYLKIQNEIKEDFKMKGYIQEDYYFISPKYIDEIKNLLYFNQIINIININKLSLDNNNIINVINLLINKLESKILSQINDNTI